MAANNNNNNLNVPSLRFPGFSDDWQQTTISEVCHITTGNKNTQDKDANGLYPFYVRSPKVERINSYTFDGEAILTAGDGVGVGKVFHYSPYGKIGVHQRVYLLNDFKCDSKFLYFYFSSRFYDRVRRMSAKNSVDSVRMDMIAEMSISLPDTIEQQKVGILLSLLDERIATQKKIIEDLKKLKSAIIDSHFKGAKNGVKLGSLISEVSLRNKEGRNIKVLSVSNRLGFIAQSEQFGDRTIASEDTSNYKIVKRNDFAYNPARINVGSIARLINFDEGIVSPMYLCFRCNERLLPEYLEQFFESKVFQTEVDKRLEGSVRLCLSFDGLKSIALAMPPLEEQKGFAKRLVLIQSKVELETRFLELYQQQRQSLLTQMFI